MTSVNGEDDDYESDPEEAKMLLAMRRRVASDDEDEDGEAVDRKGDEVADVRDSDDQGAAEDYVEDDAEEEELVRVENTMTLEIENEDEVRGGGGREVLKGGVSDGQLVPEGEDRLEGGEEEKKKHEPSAVPTAGAFYMHDDRFRDNTAARIRTLGAQKLWESKDERRWGHDKFEELTSQDSPYNESGRNPKGHHRGRGRNRGSGRGYVRGNRSKMPEDNDSRAPAPVSTTVKSRGPQRYSPAYKHRSELPQTRNKQSGKYLEISAHSSSAEGLASGSTVAYDGVRAKKNIVASNLNSASPPFYPSGTSNMDINQAPKMNAHPPNTNRNPVPPSVDANLATKHASKVSRWKEVNASSGMKKTSLDDTATKPSGFRNLSQGRQVRSQGRGRGNAWYVPSQSTAHPDHGNKLSRAQSHATQRLPLVQNRTQSYSQSRAHIVPKQNGDGSQASSSPRGGYAPLKSFENEEESPSESSKAKTVQGGALGHFKYNGTHIMGANMGVSHGDQNFPTFLPVMQFGAQHPGGIGVPAVGMAFPGYVQPQHGQGSSEMTWLPVLAGAAGALGATYCPPYMLDGSSYNHQLADPQFASSSTNKVDIANRAINENPSQKLEHAGKEFEQHQSKPRRYSEMKFGQ